MNINLHLPRHQCILCQLPADSRFNICSPCYKQLPQIRTGCVVCGQPITRKHICGRCQSEPRAYYKSISATIYASPIKEKIFAIKSAPDARIFILFAALITKKARKYYPDNQWPQAVIPVPLHAKAEIARGFNQAQGIAKATSRLIDRPLLNALSKVKGNPTQKSSSAAKRSLNLTNAFKATTSPLPSHVVLIDDVATTTETLHHCALALKKAGVTRVDAWTVARTL